MDVERWLGSKGKLAQAMKGYEYREGQLRMAQAVADALESEHVLVCEAGTGTGKTLAYLLPAILSGKKIVISTATKALQDQILTKDIPAIERYLGLHPHVALAKGLNNYLCLRRYETFRRSPEAHRPGVLRDLVRIEQWAGKTKTGDRSEVRGLSDDSPVWREVCSSSDTRRGASCPYYERCFVTAMRRRAEQARIVLANHHLVFADMALRADSREYGAALPPYEAVVFDEAHQLEEIASQFFGTRFSTAMLDSLLREARRALEQAGLADELLGGDRGRTLTGAVEAAGERFFEALRSFLGRDAPGKQLLSPEAWTERMRVSATRLDAALEALQHYCSTHDDSDELVSVEQRIERLRERLNRLEDHGPEDVAWVESSGRSVAVGLTRVDVSEVLRKELFERVPTVVLTSATLALGDGDFSFVRKRLGADDPELEVRQLTVPSPFDFPNQALLYVPRQMPPPSSSSYLQAVLGQVSELVNIARGGALVLCTSVRTMRYLQESLGQATGLEVLAQGMAPKTELLARMRRRTDLVLVATMSFWEGVDVVGEALRLVVIDKIPFAVPTEPVVLARRTALESEGRNPFTEYQLPSAAFVLKQGFGRLIRSTTDRGVVAILDSRLVTKSYGRMLLNNLPPARRSSRLEDVRRFFASGLDAGR